MTLRDIGDSWESIKNRWGIFKDGLAREADRSQELPIIDWPIWLLLVQGAIGLAFVGGGIRLLNELFFSPYRERLKDQESIRKRFYWLSTLFVAISMIVLGALVLAPFVADN